MLWYGSLWWLVVVQLCFACLRIFLRLSLTCSVLREQWIRAKYERMEFIGETKYPPISYTTGIVLLTNLFVSLRLETNMNYVFPHSHAELCKNNLLFFLLKAPGSENWPVLPCNNNIFVLSEICVFWKTCDSDFSNWMQVSMKGCCGRKGKRTRIFWRGSLYFQRENSPWLITTRKMWVPPQHKRTTISWARINIYIYLCVWDTNACVLIWFYLICGLITALQYRYSSFGTLSR